MVDLTVVCPVCGAREVLRPTTAEEVTSLLSCAIPPCPRCGWAREEDRSDPAWQRLAPVYAATVRGRDVEMGWVDRLARG